MSIRCTKTARMLFPKAGTDLARWSVIACDQYTSEPEYWEKAEELVSEKETEAEPKVSTETEKSVENPAAEEEKETEAAAAEKYDDMPEENAELPVI